MKILISALTAEILSYICRKICGDKWRFTFIIAKGGRILSGIRG